MKFATGSALKSKLIIDSKTVSEGILKPRNSASITAQIKNNGEVMASGVEINLSSKKGISIIDIDDNMILLGDIEPGSTKEIVIPVFVSARYEEDSVSIILNITEDGGAVNCKLNLYMPINK